MKKEEAMHNISMEEEQIKDDYPQHNGYEEYR